MAKPKLALIPAAYGSKFYSILPSNGVGDFDFSRSSVATRINPEGLIESVAIGQSRLDYPLVNGVQKGCPHYLLEPSSTNLIPYSEDFTQSNWVKQSGGVASAPVVTANYSISPDGTLNADRVTFNNEGGSTSSDFSQINDPVTASIGNVTNSIYIKSNTTFNYTMSLVDSTGGFTSILVTTEWQRFEVSATTTTTAASFRLRLRGSESTSDFADVSLWGAQLEVGSFATSYIPTNGTAVTRSAETANGSGDASTFNDSEGVLMAEISALSDDLTNRRITISDNSTSNRIVLGFADASNTILALVGSSGTQFISTIAISDTKVNNKFALKYKQNDFALWINGFEAATDTSGNTPTGLSTLKIQGSTGFSNFYGKTKQLQYFDSALADTQLEQLTSWLSFRDMTEAQSYTIQ